jgi:hypothetical protein
MERTKTGPIIAFPGQADPNTLGCGVRSTKQSSLRGMIPEFLPIEVKRPNIHTSSVRVTV